MEQFGPRVESNATRKKTIKQKPNQNDNQADEKIRVCVCVGSGVASRFGDTSWWNTTKQTATTTITLQSKATDRENSLTP